MTTEQNISMKTSYIKVKIDNTQHNSKFRLCGEKDETVNLTISRCGKLAQKVYKTRHDLVEKLIYEELCKRLNFNHTYKWYMHKPESFLVNETHKILWDFEIQTDHLISVRRTDQC